MTPTLRDRVLTALRDQPEGLSKSELRRRVDYRDGNRWQSLLRSMESRGEISIRIEQREYGPTSIVTAAPAVIPGQTTIDNA